MLGQHVAAEITLEVAPDGVNVVAVVLGAVVLQEEGWPEEAVVVFLAFFGTAGPGEDDLAFAGFGDFDGVSHGEFTPEATGVFPDDLINQGCLLGIHLRYGQSCRIAQFRPLLVKSQDVVRRFFTNNTIGLLGGIERLHQGPGQIFLGGEYPKSSAGTDADFGWIGSHE